MKSEIVPVLLLCTFWELCALFLLYTLLFTDQKKKKKIQLINTTYQYVRCFIPGRLALGG